MSLTEQEVVRRESLKKIIELGIEPYPAALYPVTHKTQEIRDGYKDDDAEKWTEVCLSGRLMMKRIMGKASFVELQDVAGRLQLYLMRDDLCPGEDKTMYNTVFKKLLDIGDFIGVKGFIFTTRTGETTMHVQELTLLSKSLRPLPIRREKDGQVFDGFTNPEQRYRMRYVDLVVNPQVRDTFVARSKIMQSLRNTMSGAGYLEVETPVLQPIYGGAAARPFKTKHNSLDVTLFMRISNELYLKRLIVGGYDGVFEFSRNFRNEGMDRSHNPEFTCMELYVAYKDYFWMMEFTEKMIEKAALDLHGEAKITYDGKEVDFTTPWKRLSMTDAIKEYTDVDISEMDEDALRAAAKELDVEVDKTMGKGKIIDEIFGERCEHKIVNPTFITDYPVEMSPLAKKHRDKPGLTERFEVICMGMEISNAFSELNDPIDQRRRFEGQLDLRAGGDEEAMVLDEDYLRAMEFGMPPTAGLGIGIDRIVMLLTDSHSIQEVLLFPQMRPEHTDTADDE